MSMAVSEATSDATPATEGTRAAISSRSEGYLDLQYAQSSAPDVKVEHPAQEAARSRPVWRAAVKLVNRFLMVPAFRFSVPIWDGAVYMTALAAFGLLLTTIVTALAHDAQARASLQRTPSLAVSG